MTTLTSDDHTDMHYPC